MALLPDAGIETIEDKLKTVLKLRSATVNDIPVLMHMARALAEQQGLAQLMTATAAGWRRDLGQAFDATVAAIKNKPVGMALIVCMPFVHASCTRQWSPRLTGTKKPSRPLLLQTGSPGLLGDDAMIAPSHWA